MQSTQSLPQTAVGGRSATFKKRSRTSVKISSGTGQRRSHIIVTGFSVALDAAYSALGCKALRDTMPAASREAVSA